MQMCANMTLTGNIKATECFRIKMSPSQPLSLSAEPDGPPMDVILQPVTSQSIRVTWKVKYRNRLPSVQLLLQKLFVFFLVS